MEKRIIGLVRVSTDRQETESQKNELKYLLSKKGFSKEDIVWIEEKASATKSNEKYDNFIAEVKEKCLSDNIRNIGCWSLNRIGRRETALIDFKQFCIENKIQLYCFEPELTLLNDDGSVNTTASTIYNIWIEFIRSETAEREKKLKRGKARNTEIGRYNGGKIQFGYKTNSENFFVIDPEEAEIVHKIFDLYNTGEQSVYSVSQELTLLGMKKRGRKINGPMVHKILTCKTYLGNESYPQIIDNDKFEKAGEILSDNRNKKKTKETVNVHLGAGLIRCQCCGRKYFREHKVYVCISKRKSGPYNGECSSKSVNGELLDMIIASIIVPLHIGYLSAGLEKSEAEIRKEIEDVKVKIGNLRVNLEKIRKRREKLQTEFYSGRSDMSDQTFDTLISSNDNEREKAESEIKLLTGRIGMLEARISAGRSDGDMQKFAKIYQSLHRTARMQQADRAHLKELVRMHIREITTEFNEDDKKTYIHIFLEDGRIIDVRYRIPKGWSVESCIGQMRIDGNEWQDAVFSSMGRFEKRDMYLSREVVYSIDENASKILNDRFGGALRLLKPRISDFQI